MMKLFTRPIFAASVLALSLAACSQEQQAAPQTKNAASQTDTSSPAASVAATDNLPVYKIRSTNQPYPPFNIYNPDHTISGLEADILAAIAKDQEIKIVHEPYIWDLMFKDLKSTNAHMVGGGLVKSDFMIDGFDPLVASVPYMRAPDCVVAADPKNLENWHTRPVALREEDDEEDDLMQNFGVAKQNITYVRSQYQGLQEVLAGKIPTMMSDCSVIRYYIRQSFLEQKDKFHLKELPRTDADIDLNEHMVIGVHKDETILLAKINQGIQNLKANGELEKIIQNWQ